MTEPYESALARFMRMPESEKRPVYERVMERVVQIQRKVIEAAAIRSRK